MLVLVLVEGAGLLAEEHLVDVALRPNEHAKTDLINRHAEIGS